jgi:hypothetical protein
MHYPVRVAAEICERLLQIFLLSKPYLKKGLPGGYYGSWAGFF